MGDDEREYGPGETALLPRGAWHDFWVVGDGPAETVARATPALGIELLLGTLAGLAGEGRTDERGRPRLLQGAVIGQFFREVAEFKTPPPAVQRVVLPLLAAVGPPTGPAALLRAPLPARRDRGDPHPLGRPPALGGVPGAPLLTSRYRLRVRTGLRSAGFTNRSVSHSTPR